jgi:HEAT repeat protein
MIASAASGCPRDSRSITLLIANLTGDESSEIRGAAAEELGCGGDPRAIEPLIAAIGQSDSVIRLAAIDAIARFGQGAANDGDLPLRLMTARRIPATPAPSTSLSRIAGSGPAIDGLGAIATDTALSREDDDWSRSDAAWALGRLGNRAAAYYLSRALGDPDNLVRAESARALMRLGDSRGLPVLVQHLADWFYGPRVLLVLRGAHWAAETDSDQIHLLIARRDRARLVRHWDATKAVLLADLHSRFALSALYAAIAIGHADFIPDATAALVNGGNRAMAEAFLNCGQPDLKRASEAWAKARGYTILAGPGDPPVSWGEM